MVFSRRDTYGTGIGFLYSKYFVGRGHGDGRFLRLFGQRPERAAYEKTPYVRHGGDVRLLSGVYAYARLDLRAYHRTAFLFFREADPLDRAGTFGLYRR